MMQQFTQLNSLVQGLTTRLNAFESSLDTIQQVQAKMQQDLVDRQTKSNPDAPAMNKGSFAGASRSHLQQSQQLLWQSQQATLQTPGQDGANSAQENLLSMLQKQTGNNSAKMQLLNLLQQDQINSGNNNE